MSRRRVRIHADFDGDLTAQLDWLVAQGQRDGIDGLESGLEKVLELLARFPAAGPVLDRDGSLTLRKLIFPKVPFIAWYLFDTADSKGDVWLLRLFHMRQKRPAARVARSKRR